MLPIGRCGRRAADEVCCQEFDGPPTAPPEIARERRAAVYPTQHAAATVLAMLPLARVGWRVRDLVGFAAGAVLVDADHYLSYALRKGDPSLERAYCYHRERAGGARGQKWAFRPHVPPLLVDRQRPLHALAALGCLGLAAWPWPLLRPIAWGVAFHRLLDYAWESVRAPAGRAG